MLCNIGWTKSQQEDTWWLTLICSKISLSRQSLIMEAWRMKRNGILIKVTTMFYYYKYACNSIPKFCLYAYCLYYFCWRYTQLLILVIISFWWRLDCGSLSEEAFEQMQQCGFYVEGISLAILGSFAILTNIFSIYVFLR